MNGVREGWIDICALADIPVLGARRIARSRGTPVAVFRTAQDRVFALLDRCPHKGGPLSQGMVFGDSVACPLHNWTIALADGRARAPDEGCAIAFHVQLDAGRVRLDADELATLAIDVAPPLADPCASTGALGDSTFDVQAPHSA